MTGIHSDLEAKNATVAGESRLPEWITALIGIVVFLAVLATEAHGFRTVNLFSQPIWAPIGLTRFGHYTVWFLALVVPALFLLPRAFVAIVTGLIFAATVVSVGPQAVFAVLLFLVSACALGSLALDEKGPGSLEEDARSTLAGIAIFIFVMTLTARFSVNYPLVWGALLTAPILASLRETGRRLARWGRLLIDADLKSWAEPAAFAALLFSLAMNWLITLKPETGTDGLAMHLAIATNIAAHHAMTYQPGRFIWSVMPPGADWVFAISCILGGEMAARLVNFAMLLLVEVQLYTAICRWLPRSVTFLLLALFTTTPMVQLVTGSLFSENLLAAVALGAVTALWTFYETGDRKSLWLAMALSGTALTTKFGALALVGFIVPMAILEVWRRRASKGFRPAPALILAIVLFLATALPAYTIAWWKTGNPLFPFLNRKFPSPALSHDADFRDERYQRPVTWNTPFDMTFRTDLYYEGLDGSLGFQFLLVIPFALIAGVAVRRKAAAVTTVAAAGGLAVVLFALPNARYMYPALTLFTVPFAVFLEWLAGHQRRLYYASLGFIVACTGLNIWFFPSAGWYQKDFYAKNPFTRAGREAYIRDVDPLRYVVRRFNREHPGAAVYLDSEADVADVTGEAYGAFLHQWGVMMKMRATRGVPNLALLFRQWKVRYFVVDRSSESDTSDLHDFLAVCTREEFHDAALSLAVLLPACDTSDRAALLVQAFRLEKPLEVVERGTLDDFDQAIQFHGNWTHSRFFKLVDAQTISYSNSPDSIAAMAFNGTALTYVFSRAPNRGLAEVTIDGEQKSTIDQYSPTIQWQSRSRFCCFANGRHEVVLRVTGQKSKAASDAYVDLDSFVVE